jgi:hypothetical protein
MEFTCVLSVGGSLAYYIITKHSDMAYTAILKGGQGKRDDLPEIIQLEKSATGWQAAPGHDEGI